MAKDGLSTDFQGVEGHGEAQIFGPSQTVGQFDAYMREASQDRERRKAELSMETAKLGQVSTDKIWDKDQNRFIAATQGLLKQTAEFEKKYAADPKRVNTTEYFNDKLAIQKMQAQIDFEAQVSAQSKDLYKSINDKILSDTDIYDNPTTNEGIGNILAEQDMAKRAEMLRTFRPHKNWDRPKSIKEVVDSIGDEENINYSGGVTTDKKNEIFKPGTKEPTEYGAKVFKTIESYLTNTKDGIRSIEDVMEQSGVTKDEAAGIVTQEILSGIDKKNSSKKDKPRAASADEKAIQSPTYEANRVVSTKRDLLVTEGANKGQPKMLPPVNAAGDVVKKSSDADGNIIYVDDKGGVYKPEAVFIDQATEDAGVTTQGSYSWGTPSVVSFAPEFAINMKSGKSSKPSGVVNYEISSYDKLPYMDTKDGPVLLSDKEVARDKSGKSVKWGWFAQGEEKSGTKDGREVRVPRIIPLTPALYDKLKDKLKLSDFPESELWGSGGGDKPQNKKVNEARRQFKGKWAIFNADTKEFIRWE